MTYYCKTCERKTNVKRHFGLGTFIMILITSGVWILALPFYWKRCVFCKGIDIDYQFDWEKKKTSEPQKEQGQEQMKSFRIYK